ncbi:hypothetical protein [Rubrivirga sp.]|uniref:hypothetical protein n=1 Tax=Rubrivirga sp. TaxID=1885344 RepID=UPI003C785D02
MWTRSGFRLHVEFASGAPSRTVLVIQSGGRSPESKGLDAVRSTSRAQMDSWTLASAQSASRTRRPRDAFRVAARSQDGLDLEDGHGAPRSLGCARDDVG